MPPLWTSGRGRGLPQSDSVRGGGPRHTSWDVTVSQGFRLELFCCQDWKKKNQRSSDAARSDKRQLVFLAGGHVFGVEHLLGQLRNLHGFSD